jgi:protein-tyrosine phosphatase
MATSLLKNKLPEAEVQSAGIFAGENQRANQHAIQALAQRNIALDHYSQPVTKSLLNWADIVLTMTTNHKRTLIMDYPDFQEKFFTLKEYVSDDDKAVWQELKKAYADYEEKRTNLIKQNERRMNQTQLSQLLDEKLAEDISHIMKLESCIISYDISDPFGGSLTIYQETLEELDEYIDLLTKKM